MSRYLFYLLLLAVDLYAFQALRVWAQSWSGTSKILLYTGFWSLSVLAFILLLSMQMRWTEEWPKTVLVSLRAFVFIATFSKLLVAGVMLIDDVRRLVLWAYHGIGSSPGPVDLSRSSFLSKAALILGGIPLTLLTYGMVRNRYRYQVRKVDVPIQNLPDVLEGLRIVQISDIHSGSFTAVEPLQKAVDLINDQEADLVFFTGDLVNYSAEEILPYIKTFAQIRGKRGVYSIMGNHDYGDYFRGADESAKAANLELLFDAHRQMGWELLRNENRVLDIKGEKIAIIGVENWSAKKHFRSYGDLAKAYQGTEDTRVKILLSHDPTHWDAQVTQAFKDIDLTLSGHTHGMQFGIEIPGWLKWSPAQYVYDQWAGLYRRGLQSLYVNRGLGFLGYPGRVGILAEISVLTLRQAKPSDA